MLVLNQDFFNPRNIIQFIEASTNVLTYNNREVVAQKEYWLYYYIKEDVTSNLYSLQGRDINLDIFGFSSIKRTTRHAIEAYLDMFNLCSAPEYIEVMKYCSHKESRVTGNYWKYRYNNQYTIQSKARIAKEIHGADFQWLFNISKESNSYVHPDVFVDVIGQDEVARKEAILRELLQVNFNMLTGAYSLLMRKFNNGQQPCLNCMGCPTRNCLSCYKGAASNFQQLLNWQLFSEVAPQQPFFM